MDKDLEILWDFTCSSEELQLVKTPMSDLD